MSEVVIEQVATDPVLVEAAAIWARATDTRDSRSVPTDPASKLDGIRQRLDTPGATLHVARRGQRAEGFALLVPRGAGLELVYLAVDPAAWGSGTASTLLAHVVTFAAEQRSEAVDLWVLTRNERAIETYTRAGWRPTGQEQHEDERRELRMRLSFRPLR